jgi:hypothetical protein
MIGRVAVVAVLAIALSAGGAQALTCSADFNCPYGYAANATSADLTTLSVANCCERDASLVSFPVCNATSSAGSTAVQALTADDSSWMVQDGNGFTRSVGRYVGMCFSIRIDTANCDAVADPTCCTARAPAYLQFKVPASTTINSKCRLSYGTGIANVNSLKRITKWSSVGSGDTTAKFVNVPVTFKKNQRTSTICLYSIYSAVEDNSCDFEDICGLSGADPLVPDANGNYDKGCELRILGRKSAASSACCTPTFAVEDFDSTVENRLADGASSGTIELHGV